MKYYVLLVLSVLIGASCASSSGNTDVNMDAKVAVVTAPVEKKPVYKTIYIPRLLKETSYYETDFLKGSVEYTYENDVLVKKVQMDTYGDIVETTTYEYKGGELPAKESIYDATGTLTGYTVFEYDIYGNYSKSTGYDPKGNRKIGNRYTYDDSSRRLSWEVLDEQGNILSITEYMYENGLNTRIENKNAAGNLEEYFEITYDKGNPSSKSAFTSKGVITGSEDYIYKAGLLAECRYKRANGSVKRIEKYYYDDHGSVVKTEYSDSSGAIQEMVVKEYAYSEETVEVKGE